eukprot:1424027-Amphidinium_carterae.1
MHRVTVAKDLGVPENVAAEIDRDYQRYGGLKHSSSRTGTSWHSSCKRRRTVGSLEDTHTHTVSQVVR